MDPQRRGAFENERQVQRQVQVSILHPFLSSLSLKAVLWPGSLITTFILDFFGTKHILGD